MRDLLHRQVVGSHLLFSVDWPGVRVSSWYYPFDYRNDFSNKDVLDVLKQNCFESQAWMRRIRPKKALQINFSSKEFAYQLKNTLSKNNVNNSRLSEKSLLLRLNELINTYEHLESPYNHSIINEVILISRQLLEGGDFANKDADQTFFGYLREKFRDPLRRSKQFRALNKQITQIVCKGIVDTPHDAFKHAVDRMMFDDGIIIRSSPPEATGLAELISRYGAVIGGGTVFGLELSNYVEKPELFFVFLPVGMIVIGASAGVAFGLRYGLEDYVQRIFQDVQRRGRPGKDDEGR